MFNINIDARYILIKLFTGVAKITSAVLEMSRRANILDSPEIGRRTSNQGVRNVLTRRDNQISADPLRIHLNKLHEMSELIGTSCIESAEELAEAHLEDLVIISPFRYRNSNF